MMVNSLGKIYKRLFWLLCAVVLLNSCTSQPPVDPNALRSNQIKKIDSYVGNPEAKPYARRTLTDTIGDQAAALIEYIGPDNNILEFKNAALVQQLNTKWLDAKTKGFTIAHYGDSLVQGGYAADIARARLQIVSGSAGRGMVFPYSIAKTYSQNDFKSSFTGEWTTANSIQQTPRLALGISGFVARTSSASASFTLNFSTAFETGPKRIKLFYAVNANTYTLKLQSGHLLQESVLVPSSAQTKTQVLELTFPELADSLHVDIQNSQAGKEDYFEIHGISIESAATGGVLYHNFGVGGATYGALLAQSYFEEQSAHISPDVIVLDWGTNDIVFKNSIAPNLETIITQTIRKVRKQHPHALIILTSAQDLNFRKRNITAAGDFALLMKISLLKMIASFTTGTVLRAVVVP